MSWNAGGTDPCDTVEYYGGRPHGNLKQKENEDKEHEP